MESPKRIKEIKVKHLEYCLEKLLFKENFNNELEIVKIYAYIYNVILTMENMDSIDAIAFYKDKITDEIRKELLRYNIELTV